jgi:hypothetical protein
VLVNGSPIRQDELQLSLEELPGMRLELV